jgi:hypothetical protein
MFDLKRTLWFNGHHYEATDGIKSEIQTIFPHDAHDEINLKNGQYHITKEEIEDEVQQHHSSVLDAACWYGTEGVLCTKEFSSLDK